ncbi:NADH-quinone oxidoreductase subunit NuoH [Singulisphaera sp. PoT]|uniref:NADH-quinone oxidoreductase subunit NuoH n=1 Tax=Singulisphaera sp. PoT TaxID=3411797 RepID=UPI003BF485C3
MSLAADWGMPNIWALQQHTVELSLSTWIRWFLWLALGFFGLFPGIVAYMVWAERKVAARFQDRIGPNRVGPLGLLQPIADAIKLLTKESIVPTSADRWVHLLAPVLILISAFLVLAVVPFGLGAEIEGQPGHFAGLVPIDPPSGLLYLIAVSSLTSLGIFLAGWSSRNKYALLGAMRAVAQLVSYEVPQVLATVPVILWTGSLSMVAIMNRQLDAGWFLWSPPGLLSFGLLVVANLAEVNRTPFDLPEAESEIIAGYHTEYSGMRFGLFFLAEYLSVFGVSCLGSLLFLGGGSMPLIDYPGWIGAGSLPAYYLVNLISVGVFAAKVAGFVFLMFWVRATLPRMRVDRLMNFAWKFMVPLGIVNIVAAAVWYECVIRPGSPVVLGGVPLPNRLVGWAATLPIVLLAIWGVMRVHRLERQALPSVGRTRYVPPPSIAARRVV